MRKIVLIFVTVVLPCLLCARNDDKSTDALLRQIDGIIKNRQTYGAEKEARIADLKKLLSEATSDEQRYGFCGRLFDEYRAYNCLLYTSPSPRDPKTSRMPSSA